MKTNNAVQLEVCENTEWLRENSGLQIELIEDGHEDMAAAAVAGHLFRMLDAAGYVSTPARGQRAMYHGWNGASTFQKKIGPVGTFSALTAAQIEEITDLCAAATQAAEQDFARSVAAR